MEMLNKLNEMFTKRYNPLFVSLNKNVIQTDVDTEGIMRVPTVSLSEGGATLIEQSSAGTFTLNTPARATVDTKSVYAQTVIYRLGLSIAEAEIAANKPEYFNFLLDSVLEKALSNYNNTFGGPAVQRFGKFYCIPDRPGGGIFTEVQGEDIVEFRLYGQWAGNKEVEKKEVENEQGQ